VVLDLVADGQVLRTIASQGTRLRSGLNEIVEQHGLQHRVRISGEPQRAVVTLLDDPQLTTKSFVQQTFAEHGVLFNGSMFICAHHSDDDIRRTLTAFDLACQTIASTADLHPLLVGPAVAPVFRAP
jgi:glutamate-1-semialdehyde 2,1-aminomutase